MDSISLEDLIPELKKRLVVDVEKAPFGDQYIWEKPISGLVSWPNKPDALNQLLSGYGERSNIEKTFYLEKMTRQFHAEISAIQDILVERLGADIHRRRSSAILAWQNIALPIREVEKNIICIFPSGDIYGHPIYDIMPIDQFIRWISRRAAENSNAQNKSEKIIGGLIILIAVIILIGALYS